MAPEGWVEIADAGDDVEAELILGTLRDAGIEAQSLKTHTGPGAWLTGTQVSWTPSAILVRVERASAARELLSGINGRIQSEDPLDHARPPAPIAAPGRRGRASLMWLVAVILLLAFAAALLTDMRDLFGG